MADTKVIETFEEEAPESQEHIKEMIDKAERVQSVPREDGKPKWLPDKFESPEDMAEAYAQLEQKLSSSQDTQQESPPSPISQQQKSNPLPIKGVDFEKYAREYAENGSLSEDSYKQLEQSGMTEDVVDTWLTGQQAIADETINLAHDAVGGEEEYNSLMEWSAKSLEEKEIDAFNRAIETPNPDDVVFAIKSLNARRQMEEGQAPTLLQGDTGGTGVNSFKSVAQLTKAMNDPRYNSDPAYRDEVTMKLSQSSIM